MPGATRAQGVEQAQPFLVRPFPDPAGDGVRRDPTLVVDVLRLDDDSMAFSTAAWVSRPLTSADLQVRPSVDGDDPGLKVAGTSVTDSTPAGVSSAPDPKRFVDAVCGWRMAVWCSRLLPLALPVFVASAIFSIDTRPGYGSMSSQPRIGQPGKDLVWVRTPDPVVKAMLDLAKVTPEDFVVDLGSGDGVIVIGAAQRGSRAHGIEYDPELVALSRKNALSAGVGDRATFESADLFESDFSKATVVTMFLLPSLNLRLRPKLLELRPGTRIVSNSYDMGEWQPDKTTMVGDCATAELRSDTFMWRWCTALLWVVPAKVVGNWRLPQGQLKLQQQFQMVSGSLTAGDEVVSIDDGRLLGDRLRFSIAGVEYEGRALGDTIEGTLTSAAADTQEFRAVRERP